MELEAINQKLDKLLKIVESNWHHQDQSPEVGLLMGALAKAQGEYKKLIPNERSARGNYANLEAIITATRAALSKNAIAFYQKTRLLEEGGGASLLKTIVCHESGQFTSSTKRIFPGKTLRETGNDLETNKRSEAFLILGVAPSPFDPVFYDDDGGDEEEAKLVESIIKMEKPSSIDPNNRGSSDVITKSEYNELMIALGNDMLTAQSIKNTYKLESLSDMPKELFHEALARIRRIKKAEDEYSRRKK